MRNILLATVALCGLEGGAQAATVTVSAPLAGIDSYYGIGDIQAPVFNTALGTLTNATVSTQAFLSEYVVVGPTSNVPLPGAGTFNTVFTARVPGTTPGPTYTVPVQSIVVSLTPVNIGFP